MNSEQLKLFISGAFGSEAEANQIRRMLAPYMKQALDEVRKLVELLPTDNIARQKAWKELLPAVEAVLGPYNDEFAAVLAQELPVDGLRAAKETAEQLKSVGVPMLGGGAISPEFVMADSTKFLLNTKVGDARIIDLFTPKGNNPSPFTKSNRRMIDSIVTGGIIRGESTRNIAKAIGGELPSRMRGQAEAIARTAIQDYNRQVKEEIWDANADALEGLAYEWVSALDSRTCTVCAPLDGQERPKRGDFPKTPYHVRCRCQVVLIDPDDPGRVRFGQDAYEDKPAGKGVYKTKKAVKGKELYRKNREVKTVNGESPRYADYLAGSKGVTQEMFFGGGKIGRARAERFNRYIKGGKSPQDALVSVLKGDKVRTPVAAPRPKPKPIPKPAVKPKKAVKAPKPKPASLTPQQKADIKAKAFLEKEKARQAARKAIEKATPKLASTAGMSSGELLDAINSATKRTKDKVLAQSGINPVPLFEKSDQILGTGMFGTAKLTPKGVAKRGTIAKAEIEALEALQDSGVTPKLLGQAYFEPKFTRHFSGIQARKGSILMEKAEGDTIWGLQRKSVNYQLDPNETEDMFVKLVQARKEIHLRGVAHQDMHQGNVLWDRKNKKLTVIDFGMARVDARAALVEALGSKQGKIDYGVVREAGDYQSEQLFKALNRESRGSKSPTWKRFVANKKKVESMLAADNLLEAFSRASIRVLPKSISSGMTEARALELLEVLYDGI